MRLGLADGLSSATVGAYPEPDGRDPAGDGHIAAVSLLDLGVIPEPATGLLLATGLVGLCMMRRRARPGPAGRARASRAR